MSDSDKEQLVSNMLADMCGLIVKTIALIPPEHDDARLSACAFVLDQINEAVERMVRTDRTEHQRRVRRIRLDLQGLSATARPQALTGSFVCILRQSGRPQAYDVPYLFFRGG